MPRTFSEKMQDALQRAAPFSGVCFRNVFPEFADKKNIKVINRHLLPPER